MLLEKVCLVCGKVFNNKRKTGKYYLGKKQFSKMKYCSHICEVKSRIGVKFPKTRLDNMRKARYKTIANGFVVWNKGLKATWNGEENHPSWKGENVGYAGLHTWVKKHLGQPNTCEHCKKTGLKGCSIHWSNKSGNYKREISDWQRLCAKCHKKYDRIKSNSSIQ